MNQFQQLEAMGVQLISLIFKKKGKNVMIVKFSFMKKQSKSLVYKGTVAFHC